jgi:hypothetical protein
MIDGISNSDPTAGARPATRVDRSAATAASAATSVGEPLLSSPPPEVLASLDAAQSVLRELDAARVTLHFEVDEHESGKHVRVELRDHEGQLLREIPVQRTLELLSGGSKGVAVDALG